MTILSENLSTLRRDFHRNPELGFKEDRTKEKIADGLTKLGIEVHQNSGVVGVLRVGKSNRAIALRADMDALPILETSKHDYKSENLGIMHACGHDGHTTMLLGAAEKLSQEHGFDGTVVFIFQPNEEHGLGAQAMIDEGVLQQFPVDEVYAIHNLPGAPLGQVSSREGIICSSESLFEISIQGQGGHASMPQVGVDAITVGAEMILALQTIVSRKLSPGAGAVVSVTEFETDGQRNVLPGHALLKGEVRTRLPQDRFAIEALIRQIAAGIAVSHAVKVNISFQTEFVEAINAKDPTEAVYQAAQKAKCDLIRDRQPMSFSEDFSHFLNKVPGCFLLMGNGETGPHGQPLHSSDYDFNDALLSKGVEFWVQLVKQQLPIRDNK